MNKIDTRIYTGKHGRKVLAKGNYRGIPYCVVTMGYYPCAYIGDVNSENNVNKVGERTEYLTDKINCHGGVSYYGSALWDKEDPTYYIGWDYAQYSDYNCFMNLDTDGLDVWTVEKIILEVKQVINQYLKL